MACFGKITISLVSHFFVSGGYEMQDVEIESLLEDAGYVFNPTTGRYDVTVSEQDDGEAYDQGSEEVSDILEIPIDDLQRWEAEQLQLNAEGDEASSG